MLDLMMGNTGGLSGPFVTKKAGGKVVKSAGNFRFKDLPEEAKKASLEKLAKLTGKSPKELSDEPKPSIESFIEDHTDG